MTKFYADQGWGLIEVTLLGMYAKCLNEMNRSEDYIRVLLKLLTKNAVAERVRLRRRGIAAYGDEAATGDNSPTGAHILEEEVGVDGFVGKILSLSKAIENEISTPMSHFWDNISVDPYPRHLEDRDGFEVVMKMRYLLEEEMEIQQARVRLVSTIGQVREVWMDALEPVIMKKGIIRILTRTNMTIPGSYVVDKVALFTNKLAFFHEPMAKSTANAPTGPPSRSTDGLLAAKKTKLSFYPAPRSLTARLVQPKRIHLDHIKSIELIIDTRKNAITHGELRIRSATAGLRLITSSVKFLEGAAFTKAGEKSGVFVFSSMPEGQKVRIRLPYTTENDSAGLAVKAEVDYTTRYGNFFFADSLTSLVVLPLAVNVQDVFKPNTLFSKFQVSSAIADVPLRILKASLKGSRTFEAASGAGTEGSMVGCLLRGVAKVY